MVVRMHRMTIKISHVWSCVLCERLFCNMEVYDVRKYYIFYCYMRQIYTCLLRQIALAINLFDQTGEEFLVIY